MPGMRDTCLLACKDRAATLKRADLFENDYIPLRGENSVVACVVPTSRSSGRRAINTNSLGVREYSLRALLITRRLLRSNANITTRVPEWNGIP